MDLGVVLKRAFNSLEVSAVAIRDLMLADVWAHLVQFEPDRGNGIPAHPEVLNRNIPLEAASAPPNPLAVTRVWGIDRTENRVKRLNIP